MNRRRLAVRVTVVAIAVAVIPLVHPPFVSATPIDEQKARVQQITDELEHLEEKSDILAEDYVTAIDEKNRLDAEVVAAEAKVAEQEAAVANLRGELSEVAVQAYMGAGTNGLGPMFTDSSTFTDDLQRDQFSRVALSAGTATTDELDQAVSDLNDERAILEDTRDQAAAKAEQVEQAKQATEEKKAEYTEARADAEAELGRLVQEEEERRARESYERIQAAARQAAADQAAAAAAAAQAQQRASTAAAAVAPSSGGNSSNRSSGGGGQSVAAVAAPAAQAPIPAASSRAGTAVNAAMSQLGTPYKYASSSPGVAFDCSGLTAWAWAQAGVSLPHQSRAQAGSVAQVPVSAAQPGDLLFFYSPISHVSIYLGNGQQVHAPNSGSSVKVAAVNWSNVVGVGRPG
jgi:cell wall-associated NlpC family hydrolase